MDKEDFAGRVTAMEGTLYGVARTYLKSPADCADAVQEAVLKAWKGLASMKQEAFFQTWMVRILINECRALLRRGCKTVPMADLPQQVAPPQADPALYEAVFSLDIRYRAPFVLYHVEGYTVAQIAGMLRLPKGTVTSRLHRARQKLQQLLGGDGV